MPGFLKQSTAAQSRALGPFVDDTDFKTPETALTIANTDIKLIVNGAASANKNSGGGTHRANGVYGITFDATDTATVGEMQVSVVVAGALPVFDKFFVVEEAVYDALYAGGAPGYLQPTTAGRTLDVSATGEAGVDWSNVGGQATAVNLSATTTNVVNTASAVTTLNGIANNVITAASIAANAIADTKIASGAFTAAKFAAGAFDAVWTVAARILTAATNITSTGGTTVPQTGDNFARLGAPAGASVSADIAAVKAQTAAIETDTQDIQSRLPAALIAGYMASYVDASSSAARNSFADSLLDRADAIEAGLTVRQSHRLESAAAAGILAGAGTGTVTIRNAVQDSKARITATTDASGNRTAILTDVT